MAKLVRDARLETRTARAQLAISGKPYWRALEPGLHIGYRKGKRAGRWVLRTYIGNAAYRVETLALADDRTDADGRAVLSYAQALAAARQRLAARARAGAAEARPAAPYTVGDALDAYVAKLEHEGKASAGETRHRADTLIRPALGKTEIRQLTAERLRKLLQDLADAPARLRTKKGAKPKCRPAPVTPEAKRARRSSANRTWSVLRAALNLAFEDGKVPTDAAWRRVKPFRGADAARVR